MRFAVLYVLLALCAVPARGQVILGAELTPDAFMRGDEAQEDFLSEEAFAWAMSVEVSSSSLYSVFGSTAPEVEMLIHMRKGIYRQELAALFLLSEEKNVGFGVLAAELPKAGGLAALCKKYGADVMDLFPRAGQLKVAAEARMPLFMLSASTEPVAGIPPEVKR